MDDCILIVEDDAIAQLTLARYLKDLGFPRSLAVNNGREAIAVADQHSVSLAFLDIRIMGDWDGIDTAQQMKQNWPDLPLVFVTANTDRNTLERARNVHPHAIIHKPYDRKVLVKTISEVLNYQPSDTTSLATTTSPLPPLRAPEVGISITNEVGTLVSVNQVFCGLHQCSQAEALGRPFTDFLPENIRAFSANLHREFMSGSTGEGSGTWTILDQRGKAKEVNISVQRTQLSGEAAFKLTTFIDTAPQKKAAEQLQKVRAEKDAFAREIHHRVKNNLNVVSGLFYLQSESIKDQPNVYQLFQESVSRVKAMAIIHEQLYDHEEYATIELSRYVPLLTSTIRSTYQNNEGITIAVDVAPIQLDVDQAVACGLIINELITNCFKYAFQYPPKLPEIGISGSVEGDRVSLVVRDNGEGLPDNFDLEQASTLGMQLVKTLTKQLDGQLEVHSEPQRGTSVRLTFVA
ncbi:MAG: histidine kinase dimerization/phosphoacceptor domain -containing protein [Tunicatimonas sp.]